MAPLHSWAAGNHSWPRQSAIYMPHSTSRSLRIQWDSWPTPPGALPAHPGPTLASGTLLALLSAHKGTLGLSRCCLTTLSRVVSPQGIPSWEVLTTHKLPSSQASLTSACLRLSHARHGTAKAQRPRSTEDTYLTFDISGPKLAGAFQSGCMVWALSPTTQGPVFIASTAHLARLTSQHFQAFKQDLPVTCHCLAQKCPPFPSGWA